MTAYLLDTETTSIDTPEVIQMAYFSVDPPSGIAGWRRSEVTESWFSPLNPITFGAMNVHHILPTEVLGHAPSSSVRIPPDTTYLIGHNIDFDWKALGSPAVHRICTLALCRHLWPNTDSHSLGAIYYYLEGATGPVRDRLRRAHNAAADIAINWDVLCHVIRTTGVQTLGELHLLSELARIPRVMSFGKHKGKLIEEVDKGYANWYLKQPDTDPYLLIAFRRTGLLPPERK